MTCIVGLVHCNRVHMGADSAGVAGLDIVVRRDPKLFRVGELLIGFTTSFRMGQLLAYGFTPPKRHPADDVMAWMVTEFIEAVRSRFKSGGFTRVENAEESGGCFLVGIAGRLFQIDSDFQVGEVRNGMMAVGCGAAYALGALYSMGDFPPADRITTALHAAAEFSAGVRGPFVMLASGEGV